MSNEREPMEDCAAGKRPRGLDALKKLARDISASPIGQHLRGVQREGLLLARSVLDVMVERLAEKEPKEPDREKSGPTEQA